MQGQALGLDCDQLVCVPGGPVPATLTWNSNSPSVLSISANGVVLGLQRGQAIVTASVETQATGTVSGSSWIRVADAFVALGPVAASQYKSCSLAADGAAFCWPQRAVRSDSFNPVSGVIPAAAFAAGLRFAQVSLGPNHGCGITLAGPTVCWGDNALGRSDVTNRDPGEIDGGHRFTTLSANSGKELLNTPSPDHTCGVDLNRHAWCWGDNTYGQIGTANPLPPRTPLGGPPYALRPFRVEGDLEFRQLATGLGYSCGVTAAGSVFCWGANESGQLGDGSITNRLIPVQSVLQGVVEELVAGGAFTCARRRGGEVLCWGNNSQGQLGLGVRDSVPHPLPASVAGGVPFTKISANGFACGLDQAGHSWCWGGTFESTPTQVPGELGLTALAVGWEHACAIRPAGRGVCWGNNRNFQLGSFGANTSVPRAISGPIAP